MRRRAAQVSLFIVAAVIGVLLVGQLRSQARPMALSNLSPQDLSALIETLSGGNAELRNALAELNEQVREYERTEQQGQSTLELTQEDVRRFSAFAGIASVRGQGIVMEVDIDGSFDATAVNDLINELRSAGAEAIAVDDTRVTASSVAIMGPGAITIDGNSIGSSFAVSAIGPPEGLESAMVRPGGILSVLEQSVGAIFTIRRDSDLLVPPTMRDLTPRVAEPVE